MSQSEENMFENQWRKAFDDAAETPPPRLWDAIERRLDEEENGAVVVPLWPRYRQLAFRVAATITVVLLGWGAFRYMDMPEKGVHMPLAHQQQRSTAEQLASSPQQKAEQERFSPKIAQPQLSTPNRPQSNQSDALAYQPAQVDNHRLAKRSSHVAQPDLSPEALAIYKAQSPVETVADASVILQRSIQSTNVLPATTATSDNTSMASLVASAPVVHQGSYDLLNPKSLSMRSHMGISRVVWFRQPDDNIAQPDVNRKARNKEYWTALAVTPMSFNPGASVKTNTLAPAYAGSPSTLVNQGMSAQPEIQNRPQLSVSMQVNTGMMLSKRWSLETGVAYLQGNSTAESNAVVLSTISSSRDNLLQNAVRNSVGNSVEKAFTPDPLKSDVLYASPSTSSDIVNNFRFIQVPVQAGFHLIPEGRVHFVILTGVLANIFLENTVGDVEVKPGDAVYRPVTVSGTTGLRVVYRPTRHWSGSVTGSYQHALQNGTNPDSQVQTRPQAMGVGVGMNYHF